MEIIKAHLKNGQYLDRAYPKMAITLHHTVGTSAKSALEWWDQTPARIGAQYIIDRDGKIYEAFQPDMWAYHIGINGDQDWFEKHNIGIELVSMGGLHDVEGLSVFYPLYPNKTKKVVVKDENVVKLKDDYRGYTLFHKYTDAQIQSLKELLEHLIKEFNITLQDEEHFKDFWEYKHEVINKKMPGLWSHSTLRKDKSDIFPYKPLIDMLKAFYEDHKIKKVKDPEPKQPYEEKVNPSSLRVEKAKKVNK